MESERDPGPERQAAEAGKRRTRRAGVDAGNDDPRHAGKRSTQGSGAHARNVCPRAELVEPRAEPPGPRAEPPEPRAEPPEPRAEPPEPRAEPLEPRTEPLGPQAEPLGPRAELLKPTDTVERIESELGSRQEGSVKRSQLVAAGISRHVVDRQLRVGALHRAHRGVYIVGHRALAPRAAETAAVLACGEGAVISHHSAAYLWGLVDEPPDEVEVTLVGRRCRPKPGLKIRSVRQLDSRDIRRIQGLWLTSPARTIVDLSADVTDPQLERLIAEARVQRVLREGELEAALHRAEGRPGTARLRAFLRGEGESMTRSEIERVTRRLVKAAGLPQPKINRRLLGFEVDFLWEEQRVILEVDTYTFHGHRRAFERDRRKTIVLEAAGYHVIRVTRRQLLDEPYWVIAHIAGALSRSA